MSDATRDFFKTLERMLLRGWILGLVMLLIWVAALASQVIHQFHGPMLGLSDHELDLIHYCGIGLLKMLVIAFLFIPWLSVKLVLKARRFSGTVAALGHHANAFCLVHSVALVLSHLALQGG